MRLLICSAPPVRWNVADSDKQTKSAPLPWVVLTGFLGLFAVGTPVALNYSQKKDADKKEAENTPFRMSGKDPLKPVYDFYATHDGAWNPEEDLRRQLHNYAVEFLIATVPDPIDTPYGHTFDQVVDAVQRAVERKDGYLLDRAWLPWELDRKAKPKDGEEPQRLRESYPGVMVFRHGKHTERRVNRPGMCIVFLVGETPMGGIHKRAFTRALRMMANAGHPATDPVRIVGPYFTGSQTSLQFILGDWWAGHNVWPLFNPLYNFEAITGSASAVRTKDFFDLDPYVDGHPNWQKDKFSLTSTVAPTRLVLTAMLRYLTRRDGCKSNEPVNRSFHNILPGKVAILTESNTGFGKAFTTIGQADEILVLRFPLHISRVKNEYTQAFKQKDEKSGLKSNDPLVISDLDNSNQGNEGIPAQGGSTTTAVNSQTIASILATIAREQCRYVGVVASDARDKLFLIRLIREHCPDVHIFVTDADQLLLHPDYQYHMRGVIVGSTYPLLAPNQRWVNPKSTERILFASVGAQGCYNATLMHMGLHKDLLEYAPPRFAANDHGEGDSRIHRRPPIWVSVVSPNGTMVPLQVFTDYDDSGYVRLNPAPVEARNQAPLNFPGAMLPIGIGILLFWTFLVWQALVARSSRMFWQPATSSGEFSLPQLCYRNLLLGSQAILAVPFLALVATHGHANLYASWWMKGLTITTAILLCGFLLGMVKPICWPPSRIRQFANWLKPDWRSVVPALRDGTGSVPSRSAGTTLRDRRLELWIWAFINVVLVAIVAGFALLFLSRFWIYGGETRRTLFFVRAVDLASGLSPLTPLFFMGLGFSAWAYFQLKRANQIDRYGVPPPFPVGQTFLSADASSGQKCLPHEAAFAHITELDRITQEEVRHESIALRHSKAMAFMMIGLFAGGLAMWLQALPTIEGWSWDTLFFVGFAGLFALSLTTLIRLFFLWQRTKRLLESIAQVPMMRAFARLPNKVSEVFGKYLFTQKPRLAHLQVPIHQIRLLADAVKKNPEAPKELEDMDRVADGLDRRLQEGLDPNARRSAAFRAERDLRGKLSAVSATCLTVLAPRWQNLSVEDAYGQGDKSPTDSASAKTEGDWVQHAENVVATQTILYVSQFFAQLRGLVVAAMVCTSLLLLAATSYPFHPERLLLVALMGLSAAGIASVVYVLFDMNRDEIVSRIFKTAPGKFSFDSGVIGSFFTYIVPTVGILAAQLSGSFRWLLEPIMRMMK